MKIKFLNKISVWRIVKNHWLTIVNHNTKRMEFDDILTFLIVPIIVASILTHYNMGLGDTAITIIITALSIFVGLLFNVIVLIFDIINKNKGNEEKNEYLREILSNISFAILLSVLTIVFTLFNLAAITIIKQVASFIVYSLSSNFIITVLMILKRTYALFYDEASK